VQARGITDSREVQEVVKAAQTVLGRHVVIKQPESASSQRSHQRRCLRIVRVILPQLFGVLQCA
jgi:hypothetical protein